MNCAVLYFLRFVDCISHILYIFTGVGKTQGTQRLPGVMLDEITNKVFLDLMRSKSVTDADKVPVSYLLLLFILLRHLCLHIKQCFII